MKKEGYEASLYMSWQLEFYKTLFKDYALTERQVLHLVDEYNFVDFFRYMIDNLSKDLNLEKYNKLCNNAFPETQSD